MGQVKRIWAEEPTTLLMGDSRAQNMFFEGSGEQIRSVMIDWQTPTRSKGAVDLVTFFVMSFDPDEREHIESELIPLYHSELLNHDITNYGLDRLEEDYRWGLFRPLLMTIRAIVDFGFGATAIQRFGPRLVALEKWDCLSLIK